MDIRSSDLGLLLALDALLDECNVTRAAQRLNISQPAMSAQLARLRDLFDDPLLVSSGRKMLPTKRALALQDQLHRHLDGLSHLIRHRQSFDPATSTRTFRIIAPDYLHVIVTLPLIRAARAIAPTIQLVMLPYDPATAWTALERLEADLLVAWKEVTPSDARAKHIFSDRLCMVQRVGHPRGRKKLTLEVFCNLQHIVISPQGGSLRGPVDEELEKLDRSRTVVASVPTFLAASSLVANTDLVTSMPYRLALLMHDNIEIFELPFPPLTYEILSSWHARVHNDLGHKWLRELLASSLDNS